MPFFEHDGLRLHYLEQGAGPLVVMVPGNTSGARHFTREIEHLARSYRTVAIDLRGTGQSQRLAELDDNWLHQCAGDVAALVEELADGPAALVGISSGAVIALLTAAHHPRSVRCVVGDSFAPVWSPELLQTRVTERGEVSDPQAQFWAQAHGDDWAAVVAADTRWLHRQQDAGGIDITSALTDVLVPVALTGSLVDEMVPDVGEQLLATARALAAPELHLFSDGSHPLAWTAPDRFWDVCDPFLARQLRPASADT